VRRMRHLLPPRGKFPQLRGPALFERFDDDDARRSARPDGQDVVHQLAIVRTLLDEREVGGVAEQRAHFEELRGEQLSENRTDADAGEEIALPPGAAFRRRVVSAPRMIERDGHEFVEADRALLRDAAAEFVRGSVRAG
jgi:hypothetical protein